MYRFDVPIGFEESALDSDHNDFYFQPNIPRFKPESFIDEPEQYRITETDHHLISLRFENAPLADVMKAIVSQMSNYDWRVMDGVINIFPTKGRNLKFERLLDVRISSFRLVKGDDVTWIQPRVLFETPEIQSFLKSHDLNAESDRFVPWYTERPLPTGADFSNLTFRELLNGITKIKGGGWLLRSDKSKKPVKGQLESIEILL